MKTNEIDELQSRSHPKLPRMVRLINHFTYSQKFIIISLLFAFSLTASAFYMIKDQNLAIAKAKLEKTGIDYERGIQKLMQTIPMHQWKMERYLEGDLKLKTELETLQGTIDNDFKYLIDLDEELQKELKTSVKDFLRQDLPNLKPTELQLHWSEISRESNSLNVTKSNELHNTLISNLRTLMLYIGETSQLILDPTVQVNYYIQTILWDLPKAQTLVPKMINLIRSINEKTSTRQNEDQLLMLTSNMENNIKDLKRDTKKALHNTILEENLSSEGASLVYDSLKVPLNAFLSAINEWSTLVQEVIKGIGSQSNALKTKDFTMSAMKTQEANFILWDALADKIDAILSQRISTLKKEQMIRITISFFTALIGFTFGFVMMKEISKPLSNLVKAAKAMANGDLSTRVPLTYDNEVGQVSIAFNHMAKAFQDIIGRLQTTSLQLSHSTAEIAEVASKEEAAAIEQEKETKQIATVTQEISENTNEFAKTMNKVGSSAEETSALATLGQKTLTQMETILQNVVTASEVIASKLAILNEKASNISSVTTTIAKVADQTNLLSLNASIEAEKAGEHGKSFSVIAREVRRLADQTANSLLDIEKTVDEIVAAVNAGVMSVDQFSEEIREGVAQARLTREQLSKIINEVQQQTLSFEHVNQGFQEQLKDAAEINQSIDRLSNNAQKSSQSIRQFHQAVELLNQMAQEMQDSIKIIKH